MRAQRTPDAGRLRGRALIVPTLLLLVGGISYGGIFLANKLAAGVSFPVFAYTFWIALFAGLALLIFDETLGLWVWAALACMVVGLWLVNTGARRRTVEASRGADCPS